MSSERYYCGEHKHDCIIIKDTCYLPFISKQEIDADNYLPTYEFINANLCMLEWIKRNKLNLRIYIFHLGKFYKLTFIDNGSKDITVNNLVYVHNL